MLHAIGLLVPEKTILRVFTIYGRGGHLDHDGLESPMLHANFRVNRTIGSGEKYF